MTPGIIAVTGSDLRRKALERYGISFKDDELFLTPSGQAELFHQNGNEDLIVDYFQRNIPYPVRMAEVKNRAIRNPIRKVHGRSGWPPHATIDSTFVVQQGDQFLALNKHHNREDQVRTLVNFYGRLKGAPIYSNSGIEVYTNKGAFNYHFMVFLGILNPQLDLPILESIIWNHPHYSGGMTTEVALDNEIIIPDQERPFPHLTVEQIGDRRPFLFGRIVLGTSTAGLAYRSDLFFDAAIGVLPKDFRFG